MRSRLSLVFLLLPALSGCAQPYSPEPSEGSTELRLFKPFARQVLLYSSSGGFAPRKTERKAYGYWSVTVRCDEEFSYFYMVDGKVVIPDCPLREQDDFGLINCIFPQCR